MISGWLTFHYVPCVVLDAANVEARPPVGHAGRLRRRRLLALALVAACSGDHAGAPTGEVAVVLPAPAPLIASTDTDVVAAQAELADGRVWPAAKRLIPVVRTAGRRTPEAMLVTTRAIAGWQGWEDVRRTLEPEPWLATHFDGEGHEWLARSALERGDAITARENAEVALRLVKDPAPRAIRLVLLARALDRLDVRDSAAATYRRAAAALPTVREWLLLRQAGVTAEPADRERLYAGVHSAAARGRVPYTEAQTLERFRKDVAAATAFEALGDMPSAFRLRLLSATDAAVRSGTRAGLLGYLQRDARGERLQRGIDVLDAAVPRLDETSELVVARLAAAGGLWVRAAAGFARVPRAIVTDADAAVWGRALISAGRSFEAAKLLGDRRVTAGPAAAEVRYVRAYALVRAGATVPARTALQRVLTLHGTTSQAADARYLLADLESDAGRDSRARALFDLACRQAPAGAYSDDACLRAGVLALVQGDARSAVTLLDAVPPRFPASPQVVPALYWSGRAWSRVGDARRARDRWRTVIARDPLSYFAVRSAAHLDTSIWSPVAAPIPRSPLFQAAFARASALSQLGMDTEAQYELDEIEREAIAAPALALGVGAAMLDRGDVPRAIRLGYRAVAFARAARDSTGRVDDRGYLLVFPLLRDGELIARARANDLDPALVAAVIRQESGWNPRAVSRAGALGLMQVLPAVGEEIANARRYPAWDPALLLLPEVSLELGTAHLRAALRQHSDLARALAAYNAGASRVRRWVARMGETDAELFVERIPYAETRDYVRVVLRNVEIYRALHGLR